MKIKYLKFKNWLLISAMSLLGLNACQSSRKAVAEKEPEPSVKPREEIMLMYGVPPRDYDELSKRVTNEQDQPKADSTVIPSDPPRDQMIAMYGVPTVNFSVKGRVVNAEGKPIPNAQVILLNSNIDDDVDHIPDSDFWREYVQKSATTTDAQGNFQIQATDRPWEKVRIWVRDIDGNDNGTFENQLFPIDFSDAVQTQAPQGWSQGTKEKSDVTLSINTKE